MEGGSEGGEKARKTPPDGERNGEQSDAPDAIENSGVTVPIHEVKWPYIALSHYHLSFTLSFHNFHMLTILLLPRKMMLW